MDGLAGGQMAAALGRRPSSIRMAAGLLAAATLALSGFLALGLAVPRPVAGRGREGAQLRWNGTPSGD